MASLKNSVLLDVDPSIIENNLLIADPNAGLDSLFPRTAGPASKLITPIPGLCVKLRRASDDQGKVFINLCHSGEIPAPEDITEERLLELWNADVEGTCEYRVPLSIGELRHEPDKSGRPADVFDVAVNTAFFGKVETSKMFRLFIIGVITQGVEEKFNLELEKDDYVILKNRRAMGNIPAHRVRAGDKPVSPLLTTSAATSAPKPATPLIQELGSRYTERPSSSPAVPTQTAALPTASSTTTAIDSNASKPDFRLLREPASGPARALVAQLLLPNVVSAGDVTLDVGEDRLVLTGARQNANYHLDVFLPHAVRPECSSAKFDVDLKMLTVSMPVVVQAS